MVQLGGLEPPTSGSTDRRSNQLSYSCTEPASKALERARGKLGAGPLFGKRSTSFGRAALPAAERKSPGDRPGLTQRY
jgi:hypothetical protein